MEHVEVLRQMRDTGDVSDWRLLESALDAAIAALSAPQPPAEAQPVALDYVPVKRSDLLRWAEDFVRDNDPGDDTDVVTPFDDYLLQPFADEFSHDLRALAQQPAAVDDAMVERAWEAAMEIKHNKEPWFPMTKRRMKRALTAALAAQPAAEAQAQGGGEVVDEGNRSVTRQLLHWGGVPVHVTGTATTSPGNWSLIDAALAGQQGGES